MANRTAKQLFYTGRRWRKLRGQALDADPLCRRCGAQGLTQAATTVHHIEPIDWTPVESKLDMDTRRGEPRSELAAWKAVEHSQPHAVRIDNLECVCRDCHEREHGRQRGKSRHEQGAPPDLHRVRSCLEGIVARANA